MVKIGFLFFNNFINFSAGINFPTKEDSSIFDKEKKICQWRLEMRLEKKCRKFNF